MRVLVTGGSGFIGSHVLDRLLAAGHEPVNFDQNPSPYHDGEIPTKLGDVTDTGALSRALSGCDAIIHLAAVADVGAVEAEPGKAEQVNSRGVAAVLEAARLTGVRRVIYGSTIWVYSDCPQTAVDEETETPPPRHPYTATKLAGEIYCQSYAQFYDLEPTILRFGIPYGPRARGATVLSSFVRRAMAGEALTIAGSGEQSRRFVYVEDLADGIVRALRPEAANRVYNLAGSEEISILEVAETVRDAIGGVEVVHVPSRAGDFGGKEVSSERAARELDWAPVTPFSEGARLYLDWYRANEGGQNGHRGAQNGQRPQRVAAADWEEEPSGRRVLIVSADIGEGHDGPARAIAAELEEEEPAAQVTTVDGLAEMGRFVTWILRDGSWVAFNWFPWLFEIQYFLLTRFGPTRWLTSRAGYIFCRRRLLRMIRRHRPDLLISTYPGSTELLGELRRRGRLEIPVISAITDLAGLRFWAHPGVDMHTVIHRESIEEVESIAGAGSAVWARPPTSPAFFEPVDSGEARRSLGLPETGPVILVSGGGWGVGDLSGAIEAALEGGPSAVVCIAGRNERVRSRIVSRFAGEPRLRVVGFTDRMSEYLAASDVLIHSTAGLTVLEAMIRGCRVISFGFKVGHIRANDRAYQRFGLARTARSRTDLAQALSEALAEPRRPDLSYAALPSVASVALEDRRRTEPLPRWRLKLARFATAAIASLVFLTWLLGTDMSYRVLAKPLDVGPTTGFRASGPRVGLLVRAHENMIGPLSRQLAESGGTASFVAENPPSARRGLKLSHRGDAEIPGLQAGGPAKWIATRHDLNQLASNFGYRGKFLFAPPQDGFTLGEYLLAHAAGAVPVAGAVKYGGGSLGSVAPGQVVEAQLSDDGAAPERALRSLVLQLQERGLRPVSINRLWTGSRKQSGDGS
jgi:nucleoside-diphosphate-sugar epimerase/UDP-N-acetylglucosamine:LPS N-acetylglucosamine transferase